MPDFLMPALGGDMQEGKLVAWHKKVGDSVHRGDVIAEVETAKGIIEIEAFVDGVLEKFLAEPGAVVPVGSPMAFIRVDGETAASPSTQLQPIRPKVTPAARELARTVGVDVASLQGTGPDGAVTREDVQAAARTSSQPPPADASNDQMRQTIAAAMSRSKREIPHYYLSTTIDLTHTLAWLAEENARLPITERLLPGVLFLKATALALREFPDFNSVWAGGRVERKPLIHVGVAISLRQGGLVAPAIHDTDKLALADLMAKLQDLVSRVRSGALRSSELADPTITVTSLGDQGVDETFAVINPPQVAIVGFGRLVERPWVVAGQVVPRSVVTITLSADHRVTDGHQGARFLAAIERHLTEPDKL
jgi:pyruvate dehydrogenase E2 component (dihydrolipoamide acetyltransferase)